MSTTKKESLISKVISAAKKMDDKVGEVEQWICHTDKPPAEKLDAFLLGLFSKKGDK